MTYDRQNDWQKPFPTAFKLAATSGSSRRSRVALARELCCFAQNSARLAQGVGPAWAFGIDRKRGPKPGPRKFRPLAKAGREGQQRRAGECASEDRRT